MRNVPIQADNQTSLDADDFNTIPNELKNIITGSGQSLSDSDDYQVEKAIVKASGEAQYYDDFGTANSIVLNAVGHKPILAYANGLLVRCKVGATNTGNTTVNIDGKGVKDIKTDTNAQLTSGYLLAGQYVSLTYTGSLSTGYFVLTGTSRYAAAVGTVVRTTAIPLILPAIAAGAQGYWPGSARPTLGAGSEIPGTNIDLAPLKIGNSYRISLTGTFNIDNDEDIIVALFINGASTSDFAVGLSSVAASNIAFSCSFLVPNWGSSAPSGNRMNFRFNRQCSNFTIGWLRSASRDTVQFGGSAKGLMTIEEIQV